MEYTQESLRELAERIYDLDAEVYTRLGSSLGRVFNRDRERCVTDLVQLMMQRDSGHQPVSYTHLYVILNNRGKVGNIGEIYDSRGCRLYPVGGECF